MSKQVKTGGKNHKPVLAVSKKKISDIFIMRSKKTNVFGGRHRAVIIEREMRYPDVSSQQNMAESQEVYLWV